METTTIDTPDGPIDALLSVPEGEGPWPGVVVMHDICGYGPDNESMSRRIAAAGYIAITPNMYSRGGIARCVTRVLREVLTKRGRAIDDILARATTCSPCRSRRAPSASPASAWVGSSHW